MKDHLINSACFSPHQRLVVLDKVHYSRPRQYRPPNRAHSNAPNRYGTGPRIVMALHVPANCDLNLSIAFLKRATNATAPPHSYWDKDWQVH